MSNMKVRIKERDDEKFTATAIIEGARLGFFAEPSKLTEFVFQGNSKHRYDGQFHLDKDAEGAQDFIDMLFDFKKRQSNLSQTASLFIKDGDSPEMLLSKKGVDISKSNAGTWIINCYRQPSQEIGTLISKKAYQEGDEIPAGWLPYNLTTPRPFIAKTLTSPDEISGNDIVHMIISVYKVKDVRAVHIGWESMQLVKHVGKNNRGSVEDFADLPDTEDEAQADNEVENSF